MPVPTCSNKISGGWRGRVYGQIHFRIKIVEGQEAFIDRKSFARRLRHLDRTIFRTVFRFKWGPLSTVLKAFTVVGSAGFLWGVLAFAGFLASGASPLFSPVLLVPWGAVAVSWIVVEGAKYLFNRARPFIDDTEIAPLIKTPSSSSFPSGHSATAAAGSITLSAVYPQFAPALLLSGFLVVLSRVYLGVHYPFDVFAGALIGSGAAMVALLFLG